MLERLPGFEVVGEVGNGLELPTRAQEYRPDVIVMDMRMRGGNGIEGVAAIREHVPEIKVLVLTVSDRDVDLFAALKAGARGYLLKDVQLRELVEAIRLVAKGEIVIAPAMAARLIEEFQEIHRYEQDRHMGGLSPREREILRLVAQGASNKEIAGDLYISQTTVKAHLRSILEKLDVKNRAEAVAKATARGLFEPWD